VIIHDVGGGRAQSAEQSIVEFEMGGLDDMLAIRWLASESLEVTISEAITVFARKEKSNRGINIQYKIVAAGPWSHP
jgi:hypothetical protein